jgi:hypothetical protein
MGPSQPPSRDTVPLRVLDIFLHLQYYLAITPFSIDLSSAPQYAKKGCVGIQKCYITFNILKGTVSQKFGEMRARGHSLGHN